MKVAADTKASECDFDSCCPHWGPLVAEVERLRAMVRKESQSYTEGITTEPISNQVVSSADDVEQAAREYATHKKDCTCKGDHFSKEKFEA